MKGKDCGYAGRIPNAGSMKVQAPYTGTKKSAGKVTRGDDLRTGK